MDAELDAERHQEIARCLFRESNDAVFLFDPRDNRVLDLNPVAQRLTGLEKDRARELRVWDLFTGAGAVGIGQLIDAYRRTGFFHSREGFSLTKDSGEPIPVNVSVSRIHTQPGPLGLIVARDITERRKAEQAIEQSERRYRSLVETAGVVIWMLSAKGTITSLNPQFEAITGWAEQDWVGRALSELVHPDDRALVERLVESARSGEATPITEVRILSSKGEWRVFELLSMAKFDDGPSAGVSGIARDVTELRKAEEALQYTEAVSKAKDDAERADRAKSEFLANISHEIRTPMSAILGFVDILLGDDHVRELPPERIDDLLIIRQNGNHLVGLVNEILELSEIEAGKLRIGLSTCAPDEVASELLSTMRVQAAAKNLALRLDVTAGVPDEIQTDVVRLRQILMNLLNNAIKFTERGEVCLRLLATHGESGADTIHFEVIDSGVGLTAEEIARLFEPFSRPGNRDPDGTGLGLAICRKLAERLGGQVTVNSKKGQGSTFVLHLPVRPRDDLAPSTQDTVHASVAEPLPSRIDPSDPLDAHILLVEDNPALQRLTSLYMQKLGASVVVASNGREALELTSSATKSAQPFDVILMDMQMPVLDGYEATRQLRASGYRGTIIALTAYAMANDRQECLDLGCDEHLSKPIDWLRLRAVIADCVASERAPHTR
jgi:PAS domain S-box-containing protein